MLKHLTKSLRNRIFFCITVFVLLPVMVGMIFVWKKVIGKVEQKQIALYEENTLYLAQLCEQVFDDIKDKVLFIYHDDGVMTILKDREKNLEHNLENQKRINSKVNALFYSDDNIESVAFYVQSTQLMIYKKKNASTRFFKLGDREAYQWYFIENYASDELTYAIDTVWEEETGEWQIVYNQNIKDERNQPLVRMEIVYNQNAFEPIFNKTGETSLSYNFVLGEGEKVFYEEHDKTYPQEQREVFMDVLEGGDLDAAEYLIIKKKMERYPYYVVKCVPTAEIFNYLTPFRSGMAILFALILGAVAVIAVVLTRLVRRPIERFTESIVLFRSSGASIATEVDTDIEEMQNLALEFSAMMREINQLIADKSDALYKEKRAQLNMLMVQLNPHFLYNVLQSLQYMALKREAFEINAMLTSLGKILRYSLGWENQEVTLKEELENTIEYLNIQKYRYVDELKLELEVPDTLPDCQFPKMILQPLVENCFVHGFHGKTEDYRIYLEVALNGGTIEIQICDNGWGMEEAEIEALNHKLATGEDYEMSDHTGICSVNFRLRQKYGEASMQLLQEELFCVFIRIPGGYDESIDN